MKENYTTTFAPEEEGERGIPMTLDASDPVSIIKAVIALYSKPWYAILREYTSNAWDAHREAGQTEPVRVTLPSWGKQNLVIQDLGTGLNWDTIPLAFSKLNYSTKRNQNTQRGKYGFGAKSAIMVADRFTIVGVKDGIKTTAECVKNRQGIGEFFLRAQGPTDEPNGVTVTIPVKDEDPNVFNREEVFNNFFIGWEPGSILIDNRVPVFSLHNPEQFTPVRFGEEVVGWLGTEVSETHTGHLRASFGGVDYPITYHRNYRTQWDALGTYRRQVYLNLPLGSVEVTPSREELAYTDITVQAIKLALNTMQQTIELDMQRRVELAVNAHAAMQVIIDELHAKAWRLNLTYRGEQVPTKEVDMRGEAWALHRRTRSKSKLSYTTYDNLTGKIFPIVPFWNAHHVFIQVADEREAESLRRAYPYFLEGRKVTDASIIMHTADLTNTWLQAAATEVLDVTTYRTIATEGRKTYKAEHPVKKVIDYRVLTPDNFHGRSLRLRDITAAQLHATTHRLPVLRVDFDDDKLGKWINPKFKKDNKLTLTYTTEHIWEKLRGHTIVFAENKTKQAKLTEEYPSAIPAMEALTGYAREEQQRAEREFGQAGRLQTFTAYSQPNHSRNTSMMYFAKRVKQQGLMTSLLNPDIRAFFEGLTVDEARQSSVYYNSDLVAYCDLKVRRISTETEAEVAAMVQTANNFLLFPTSGNWHEAMLNHVIDYVNMVSLQTMRG